MKTDTLKNISLLIATAMLLAMASYNLNAQPIHYRFTGTVEETDPAIPFTSLVNLPPGLTQVRAGDRVTGSFRINPKSPPSARLNGAGAGALFYKESVEDFRLEIGGRGLITFSVPGDEAVLFNDWNLSGNNPFVTPPIYAPLDAQSGPQVDGLLIHASRDQVQIGGGVSIKVHLNFTDSTASTVQRLSDTPTENSTFYQRDLAKVVGVAKPSAPKACVNRGSPAKSAHVAG